MKKILITGKNSYVGNSFEKWVANQSDKYSIEKMSMRDDSWKNNDFSSFDVILHVAGIAHVSTDPKMEELYYKVNRDLTIEIAKKAKADGVKQFVFLSSIIVYGDSTRDKQVINRNTIPEPSNFYGNSKLQAEEGIKKLEDDQFKIVIIRPPMIYGKDSKGNYPKLAKAARKLPIFPDIDNQRSMLHIDNLSEFIRLMIENEESGLFFPQNTEYVRTSEMVKRIANIHGKKIRLVKVFNPFLKLIIPHVEIFNKVFGNLIYEKEISLYDKKYQIWELEESLVKTEKASEDYRKTDILLMADNSLETVGGEQESTKIIINGIKKNFRVGIIQPGEIKNPILGVDYYLLTSHTRIKHLIKHPIAFIGYILKVRSIIKNVKPKIIHTQAQVSFFIVSLLSKLKLIPNNIKIIHTERGLYTKYGSFIKRIFRIFLKELDLLVTTTEFNMRYWREAIQKWDIEISFNIIENTAGGLFELYDPNLEDRDKKQLVLGFAGRYTEWKNWPLAVEISRKLNILLGKKLNVHMAVGCLNEASEKETMLMFNELQELLGSRFKGEINIDLKAMNQFYYNIDVFILTSHHNTESFGRTLVEAMSRKTAVLTTDAGGSVEVVGNLEKVCKTSDEFVQKVLELHNDEQKMIKEKAENLMRVKERYSLKNNIDKHLKMYSEIFEQNFEKKVNEGTNNEYITS